MQGQLSVTTRSAQQCDGSKSPFHALQGVSTFLLQAVCTRSGELRALLVLGHADAKPFEHHAEWDRVHELLDVMLFAAVHASRLASYVAFAELLQLMPSEADTVLFLSHWLPPLLVGVFCCISVHWYMFATRGCCRQRWSTR